MAPQIFECTHRIWFFLGCSLKKNLHSAQIVLVERLFPKRSIFYNSPKVKVVALTDHLIPLPFSEDSAVES